jgi:hypothetical protein
MGSRVGRTGRGSNDGCLGSITTLGEGPLLKSSHWGVAWKQGGTGAGDESVEAAGLGGGLQEGTGNRERLGVGSNREITLGGSCVSTLGQLGIGYKPAGQWSMQMPRFKDNSKVGDCIHLGDTCGRHRLYKGSGNNLKAMDDSILCGWCRDGMVRMAEFDCIEDNLAFGVRVDKFEAAVGLQGWTM